MKTWILTFFELNNTVSNNFTTGYLAISTLWKKAKSLSHIWNALKESKMYIFYLWGHNKSQRANQDGGELFAAETHFRASVCDSSQTGGRKE